MNAIKTFDKLTPKQKEALSNGVIEVSGTGMNRTALGIVDAVFTLFPKITFEELKRMLPDEINPSAPRLFKSLFKPHTDNPYGVVQPGTIRKEAAALGINLNASHFTEEGETFTTEDGVEVLVSKIWESKDTETGESDLQNLINHVAQYGIKVVSFTSRKAFQKGSHKLNIINPVLIQEISQISNQPDVLQPDQSPTLSEKQYHASPNIVPAKNKLPVFIILFILFILLNGTLFYWVNANSDQNSFFETLGVITKKYEDLRITASRFNQILYADNYSTLKRTSLNASKETIYFRFKSDQLTDEAKQKLREIFEALTTNQNLKYQIHGYTSNEGEETYNIDLSIRRAQKVSEFLTAKGIDPSRLIVSGKGSEDNIADNNTEEGRSRNRRVELVEEK